MPTKVTTELPSLTTPIKKKPVFELPKQLPPSFFDRVPVLPPPRW